MLRTRLTALHHGKHRLHPHKNQSLMRSLKIFVEPKAPPPRSEPPTPTFPLPDPDPEPPALCLGSCQTQVQRYEHNVARHASRQASSACPLW